MSIDNQNVPEKSNLGVLLGSTVLKDGKKYFLYQKDDKSVKREVVCGYAQRFSKSDSCKLLKDFENHISK